MDLSIAVPIIVIIDVVGSKGEKMKSIERWYVTDYEISPGTLVAESSHGKTEYITGAHCKACAYMRVILMHGGDCDLRGLNRYGECYSILALTVSGNRRDAKVTKKRIWPGDKRAKSWGMAHGYFEVDGGWIYNRRGRVCHGWGKLYKMRRPVIDRWIAENRPCVD